MRWEPRPALVISDLLDQAAQSKVGPNTNVLQSTPDEQNKTKGKGQVGEDWAGDIE